MIQGSDSARRRNCRENANDRRRAKRAALSHPSPPPRMTSQGAISNQSALRIPPLQAGFTPWRHSLLAILSILLRQSFRLL
ncbi:hypothetical protein KCP74_17090 [Salmonella enterica subsp. enterica]|nr:hypothetical protein KCP74_17090 [Salmonella enterica subsp. enterica]